jgi:hypothetical protein
MPTPPKCGHRRLPRHMHTAAALGYPASHFPYATPRDLAREKSTRRLGCWELFPRLLPIRQAARGVSREGGGSSGCSMTSQNGATGLCGGKSIRNVGTRFGDDEDQFGQGKPPADADAQAGANRHVGETRRRRGIRHEARRIESFRRTARSGTAVQDPQRDHDERSLATTIVAIWSPNRSAACAGGVGDPQRRGCRRGRGATHHLGARRDRLCAQFGAVSPHIEQIAPPMISSASR